MHFNTAHRVITFTVDDDKFTTKPAIGAGVIFNLQQTMQQFKDSGAGSPASAFNELKEVYRRILTEESWAVFESRLDGDCDDGVVPIDVTHLFEITRWIIGEGLGKGHLPQASSSQDG